MIDCLQNHVGLLFITDAPTSGKYINDEPFISTEMFESVRDTSEQYDGQEGWSVIETRAIDAFESDLRNKLKKYFRNYSIFTSFPSHYLEGNDNLSTASKYIGLLFDSNSWSPHTKLIIENVQFHGTTNETVTIKIFDATSGKELHSTDQAIVEGFNEIKLNKGYATYKYQRIFVCYDDGVTVKKLAQNPGLSGWIYNRGISTASSVVHTNLSSSDVGMSVTYSFECSIDNLVCQRLSLFTQAYIYRLAIEILREAKGSPRVNRWTILDRPEIDEWIQDYSLKYEKELDSVLKGLDIPSDYCFQCQKEISQKVMLP